MVVTTFEVYAYTQRGWQLHARFPSSDRDEAMAEARDLETQGIKSKVTKEIYDPKDNSYNEADIYVSKLPERAAMVRGGGGRGGAATVPGAAAPMGAKRKQAAENVNTPKALIMIVAVLLLSGMAGLGLIYVLPTLVNIAWHMGFHFDMSADSYSTILSTAFAAAFLGVGVPMLLVLYPRMLGPKRRGDPTSRVKVMTVAQQQHMVQSLDSLSRQALQMEEQAMAMLPDPEPEPELIPESEPEPQAESPEIPPAAPAAAPLDEGATSPAAAGSVDLLGTFVDGAINAVHHTKIQLDSYNKFAMHLYLAGAVETLCQRRELLDYDRRFLTVRALAKLGTKQDMASRFYDTVGDYLREDRYHRMVVDGRAAMEDYLGGDTAGCHSQLTATIQEWNRGQTNQPNTPTMTVMFTDMVGSTDMTQDKGDAAAQEIVRRHNTIVRMAISQYGGREIKHTGDGIMAGFDDATGAIDAAITIQRSITNHNQARPDQYLSLRIGLNTGKPIQEENDIFGSTVQLAARVCAATQPDEILATESVKLRSRGRDDFITAIGAQNLKGFKDPIPLFRISW